MYNLFSKNESNQPSISICIEIFNEKQQLHLTNCENHILSVKQNKEGIIYANVKSANRFHQKKTSNEYKNIDMTV